MKLRFRSNTLRLRVNRREVEGLASGESIEECVLFPDDGRFRYVFEPKESAEPRAAFQQGAIRISAPLRQVREWANGDAIGLYFNLPAGGTTLDIAIEKDLECIDGPADEHDPDAFPRKPAKDC